MTSHNLFISCGVCIHDVHLNVHAFDRNIAVIDKRIVCASRASCKWHLTTAYDVAHDHSLVFCCTKATRSWLLSRVSPCRKRSCPGRCVNETVFGHRFVTLTTIPIAFMRCLAPLLPLSLQSLILSVRRWINIINLVSHHFCGTLSRARLIDTGLIRSRNYLRFFVGGARHFNASLGSFFLGQNAISRYNLLLLADDCGASIFINEKVIHTLLINDLSQELVLPTVHVDVMIQIIGLLECDLIKQSQISGDFLFAVFCGDSDWLVSSVQRASGF